MSSKPDDNAKRLSVAFETIWIASLSNQRVQLFLGDVAKGWMSQIMRKRRGFNNIRIDTAKIVRERRMPAEQILG